MMFDNKYDGLYNLTDYGEKSTLQIQYNWFGRVYIVKFSNIFGVSVEEFLFEKQMFEKLCPSNGEIFDTTDLIEFVKKQIDIERNKQAANLYLKR